MKTITKYVVEVTEFSSVFEGETALVGWDENKHYLKYYNSQEDAEEDLVSLFESQDSDFKVEVNHIGCVEVPCDEVHV